MLWLVLGLSLVLGSVKSQVHPCYGGWVYKNGICYGYGDGLATWGAAQGSCHSLDAKLAEPRTQAEIDAVKELAKYNRDGFVFIGGTDVFQEGSWKWATNATDITDNEWGGAEPNGGVGEDCMALWTGVDYKWADIPCHHQHEFICQRSAAKLLNCI